MNDSVERIKTIFPRVLEKMPIKREFKIHQAMYHWADIVGSDIAAQSEPLKIEYRVLWLGVRSSVWSHHLMMMKRQLIDKLNAYCAEALIVDMKFVSARAAAGQKSLEKTAAVEVDEQPVFRQIMLTAEASERIRQAAALVKDSELSQKAARLYRDDLTLRELKRRQGFTPCRRCGVLCSGVLCTVCAREERQKKMTALRRLLNDLPWFTYAKINRELPCDSSEYIAAKIELLQQYADKLPRDEQAAQDSDELIMLTMLFCGVSCNEITDELMYKTYKKFRRRF